LLGEIAAVIGMWLAPSVNAERVRGLLTALAYARGGGITDRLWLRIAAAFGYQASQTELETLRDSAAADFLLQSSHEQDGTITRLYHQALIDQLLALFKTECLATADLFSHRRRRPRTRDSQQRRTKAANQRAKGGANFLIELRRIGHTLVASLGASTRELMHRMGHPILSKSALAARQHVITSNVVRLIDSASPCQGGGCARGRRR
jgi:hypothetical protein